MSSPRAAELRETMSPLPSERWLVAAVLLAYTVFMAAHAYLTNYNLDSHGDMLENYGWGITWQWGYIKHPPMFAWITAAWFSVFPRQDWAYYLLSAVNSSATILLMWCIAGRYLGTARRIVLLAVAILTPPIFFLSIKYNANSAMLPFWAGTFLFYLRTLEQKRVVDAAILGILAAAAVLTKYHSVVLLGALLIHAVWDRDVRPILASRLTAVAAIAFLILAVPHLVWLVRTDFLPITYAANQGDSSLPSVLYGALKFTGALLLWCLPGFVPLIAMRRRRAVNVRALNDIRSDLTSNAAGRALLVVAVLPYVLTIVLGVAAGADISSVWALPLYFVVPLVMMLLIPEDAARRHWRSAMATLCVFVVSVLALSPLLYERSLANPRNYATVPLRPMALEATRLWRDVTGSQTVFHVAGDQVLKNAMTFYSPARPWPLQGGDVALSPWAQGGAIEREGLMTLCILGREGCVADRETAPGVTTHQLTIDGPGPDGTTIPWFFVVTIIPPVR
jgi:4-amino-4-deoxy-L-arabinose transferase-like glycosyltransferase